MMSVPRPSLPRDVRRACYWATRLTGLGVMTRREKLDLLHHAAGEVAQAMGVPPDEEILRA